MKKMHLLFAVIFGFLVGLSVCHLLKDRTESDAEFFSLVLLHDVGTLRKFKGGHVSSIEEELERSIIETVNEIGLVLSKEQLIDLFQHKDMNRYSILFDALDMAYRDVDNLKSPELLKIKNTVGILKINSVRNQTYSP